MKFLFLFALIPQFAFAGSIFLTLSAEQGLSKLKLPGEVLFESTNVFCEERGLTPQPWSAPRKQKFVPKVISLSGNTVVLEISTETKNQGICRYKFSGYSVWSDDSAFFISLEAANKSNMSGKDAQDLELTSNENSLYSVDCASKKNFQRSCSLFKDGVKKGHKSGNGSRLMIDMKRLEAQKEIRPSIEFKQSQE